MCIGNLQNTVFLIDVTAPGDSRLAPKVNEKRERHIDLKIEIQRMWNMHAVIVPVVIACLGSVLVCLVTNFRTFNIYNGLLISKKILNRTHLTLIRTLNCGIVSDCLISHVLHGVYFQVINNSNSDVVWTPSSVHYFRQLGRLHSKFQNPSSETDPTVCVTLAERSRFHTAIQIYITYHHHIYMTHFNML